MPTQSSRNIVLITIFVVCVSSVAWADCPMSSSGHGREWDVSGTPSRLDHLGQVREDVKYRRSDESACTYENDVDREKVVLSQKLSNIHDRPGGGNWECSEMPLGGSGATQWSCNCESQGYSSNCPVVGDQGVS